MSNIALLPEGDVPCPPALDDLANWLATELRIPSADIIAADNLLMLGLDSLRTMACVNRLRVAGHGVTLKQLLAKPSLKDWSCLIRELDDAQPRAPDSTPKPWPTMLDGAAFPLTDIQHAYLVGRGPAQPLGGVGCHLYQEFDGNGLTLETLNHAILTLIYRHPMLNVAIRADGAQRWIGPPRWTGAHIYDLRDASPQQLTTHAETMRATYGHRLLDVQNGACFDFRLTLLPGDRHRLHVNLDLLILDAASFSILFSELAALLAGHTLPPLDRKYDFRAYLAEAASHDAALRTRARTYWQARLENLPPAPALPMMETAVSSEAVTRHRRRHVLDAQVWARFSEEATRRGHTPTMALATAFAMVMARWSNQPRLLLNVPIFDRQPFHPDVTSMIGDFTKIILVDMAAEGESFSDLVRQNIDGFTTCWEYRDYSGIEILRDLRKRGQHPQGAPIVFTGALGDPLFGADPASTIGSPGWGVSQTPQVSIDHLAYRLSDSVCLQWDSADPIFPAGMVDAMFGAYVALIDALAADTALWEHPLPDLLPEGQRRIRAEVNDVRGPLPQNTLHDGFFHKAVTQPEAIAIIHRGRETRYGELDLMARRCARSLLEAGVKPGDRVAICMARGVGHVVSVLAILSVGAAYVPLAYDQPEDRLNIILNQAGINILLTSSAHDAWGNLGCRIVPWETMQDCAPLDEIVHISNDALAYVIYTSGSTGVPKGVMISHRAALNSCADINRRIALTPSDRILALAALYFDLSVYDIFGALSAGAAIVMLDEAERRDPGTWCTLIARHNITVWNSVPSLFDMLITYAEGFETRAPAILRVALLSGDWIGLDLAGRFHAFNTQGRLLALGGATEAAIWSNHFEVGDIDPSWRSIPYGHPLTNQKFRVVDHNGRDCPDWISGELWIGGAGVAMGYLNDPTRTAAQFVRYQGERWYETGDMGRYWPDGTLEFLGRRDRQVKIGGYRIELAEIDVAFSSLPGIRQSLTLATEGRDRSLITFLIPASDEMSPVSDEAAPANEIYKSCFRTIETSLPATDRAQSCAAVRDFIAAHLDMKGLSLEDLSDPTEACAKYGATPHFLPVFEQWAAICAEVTSPVAAPLQDFETLHHPVHAILTGAAPPNTLLDDENWAPETQMLTLPGTKEALHWLADAVPAITRCIHHRPLIVEIGARSGLTARYLMRALPSGSAQYIATDESAEMICRAEARDARDPGLTFTHWHGETRAALAGQADIVLANNALHRLDAAGLDAVMHVARPGALIFVMELAVLPPLACVSADLLNGGHSLADRIISAEGWRDRLAARGLICEDAVRMGDQNCLILHRAAADQRPDIETLRALAARKLPEYMIPRQIRFLDAWPLTPNGKIDHAALLKKTHADDAPASPLTPAPQTRNAAEACVAAIWKRLLKLTDVTRDSHFFAIGGDSLLATRLIGALASEGYEAQLNMLFARPVLSEFAATLTRAATDGVTLTHDIANRYAPFPLSDVQQAYLVGRQPDFALGGVGSQFFITFDVTDLDVKKFEHALNHLIRRHDMLRCVVRGTQQQVLEHVPVYRLNRRIFPSLDSHDLEIWRDALSHQLLNPESWPVFDIQAASDGGNITRIFMTLDNLMLDGMSMQIFLAELDDLYTGRATHAEDPGITFRDYQVHQALQKPAPQSRDYWRARLPLLPPAPPLPLKSDPAQLYRPVFKRLSSSLTPQVWSQLKSRAAGSGVTPSTVLLAAFCTSLSRWSQTRKHTLNLTLFDRTPIHPQIDRILGDFTSLLLLEWSPEADWRTTLIALQQRLGQDLAHRDVSAIWVMRQLAASLGQASASMPVIFTSAIGVSDGRFLSESAFLKPRDGISQTPQVWLDHQVYEADGRLHFNWDVAEALFDPAMLKAQFGAYCHLLTQLVHEDAIWEAPMSLLIGAPSQDATRPESAPKRPATSTRQSEERHERPDPAFLAWLCQAFEEVTGYAMAPRQNFFDRGGTSLHLVQFHKLLRDAGYSDLTVTDLFSHASPQELALHLKKMQAAAPPPADAGRLMRNRRKINMQRRTGSLTSADRDDHHE
ncbi:amino acid adenylation domain-containing protein [Candidatus Kirkpatrickella diaphorinae]|uniref:Amino acid adenylation domain-containing protein n=1 Tax=Candidatus Kirkpatrickella diaphorinae TaxID=2984322 RepID=A0ABY6GJW6_9PROT|nr:non-ribosomal peptide synthetase [Candidatus Kirkpatrickella diaphorinae]UYH51624.1 amino acid adenylation domain-containing protein [Candidatus Kirkpatrickella diaphorinae]